MKVNEIFTSIQGEGTRAGLVCTFVRFTGCNLRCTYCDTEYAFYEGKSLNIPQILERVSFFGAPLVCVTGGEPMLQREIVPLLEQLLGAGYTVLLETGGQQNLQRVPVQVVKIVDIKTPGAISENPDGNFANSDAFRGVHFNYCNLDTLRQDDEIKIVVTGRFDYEWAKGFINQHRVLERVGTVLLSPCHGRLDPALLSSWILEDRLPVRLNLQLHKYIWGVDARGV
ncbi:MAG: radical SAM protein [Myxococcales bacterium]|nr:radical SAM protein [Myxococcales bacterium]